MKKIKLEVYRKTVVENIAKGLPSGKKVWVRVRAIGGSTGFGPWSDPAVKMVA